MTGSAEFRLVYSVRSPADVYYAKELARLERDCDWLRVAVICTRVAAPRPAGHPAGSASVISQCPGGHPTMVYASTSAVQRDSWNR